MPPEPAPIAVIDRIPLDARVVLDVGCGDGTLGAEYKRRNPNARYLGIERDAGLARLAATRLDQVAAVDVEQEPLPFGDEPIDCIVYNDILEHLADPWRVLERQAAALRDTGAVVWCVPNLEHWSLAERLLRGTWDYDEEGLLDRGHLRWFTPETARRALLTAGLWPQDCVPMTFDQASAEAFAHAMEPSLRALGIDTAQYLRRAAPLLHLWRATRTRQQKLHVVSTMLPPIGGVSHVRVVEPMQAIATDPAVIARVTNLLDVRHQDDAAELFVFHRPALLGEDGLNIVRMVMNEGYLTICEFDDNPEFIPILQHPEVYNFAGVHAVQTSTEPLAALLRQHNPEVAVFPNAVARLPEPRNYTNPQRVSVLFAGINRDDDWPPCLDALNAAAAVARERLHFEIISDRALFDALATPHKSFTPLCDYQTYQDIVSRCEVSFMPLADTPFNRCKSDLKFIEAAAARVTALASPVVYGESIVDGQTGVLFRSPEELQQRLLRLVANPEIGRGLAEAARAHVAQHRMQAYQVAPRLAWYRSLWARREALHAALLQRVPALAAPGHGKAPTAGPRRPQIPQAGIPRRFGHPGSVR